MNRRKTRFDHRDANEPEIREACEAMGIPFVMGGVVDAWTWIGGWMPVEIKVKGGKFTPRQLEFFDRCDRNNWPYLVWYGVEDVEKTLNEYRKSLQ